MEQVPMKRPHLADSDGAMRSHCDLISKLPDDILCDVLSYLTLRDATRTRLLSRRWRYLPYCHSVFQFDAFNVFGKTRCNRVEYQPMFVKAVDQFLEQWRGHDVSLFQLKFGMCDEYALHIDKWIQNAVRMEIKELDLCLRSIISDKSITRGSETYVFSGHPLNSGNAFPLKCLRLACCPITLSSGCTNWISRLSTLCLSNVHLKQNDLECILSGGRNLTSLSLNRCCPPTMRCLNVELPYLEKLTIIDNSMFEINLSCPNLEILEYKSPATKFNFSHVPRLREVGYGYASGSCSYIFEALTRNVPSLQKLFLYLRLEVKPLPFNITPSCLKQLDLLTNFINGKDICTILYILQACPFLEILHLKLKERPYTLPKLARPEREYPDGPYVHLKEVKMDGFSQLCNEMKLAQHVLMNAVALQRMLIILSNMSKEMVTSQLQHLNTTAELVVLENPWTFRYKPRECCCTRTDAYFSL